jgi:ribosomal protein S18 acetylase RimI-like enzyme
MEDVAHLVRETFGKYNNEGENKDAVNGYIAHFSTGKENIDALKKMFLGSFLFFVATDGNKIVGMIRGRKERITNLFVSGDYHSQGIGTKLVEAFEKESLKRKIKIIRIKASLFAVPFYQKMGYKKTTGIRNFIGLKIQPMSKLLKQN